MIYYNILSISEFFDGMQSEHCRGKMERVLCCYAARLP